jgi:transketolase
MQKFFRETDIKDSDINELKNLSNQCRGDILKMTTLASSGHPGGSMSTVDMLLLIYKYANISPENYRSLDRDRIIVSHGHTSPAVYSVLGRNGFFHIDDAISQFRLAGSIFEGHIERSVPGVEWSTGNLGQGLSAACGMALSGKLTGRNFNIYTLMGDGEQQKGQLSEARRFAVKHKLNNITAFIDYNKLQISGNIDDVMPQNIKDEYVSDGWMVFEADGHDFKELFNLIKKAEKIERPVMIMARTIMGKNVSFMEDIAAYHGKPLSEEQLENALNELKLNNDIDKYKELRSRFQHSKTLHQIPRYKLSINTGKPKVYSTETKTDNRSAFGNALTDILQHNSLNSSNTPIAVFDCDLAGSVKTDKASKEYSEYFFESGIQEHHTATTAGAASVNSVVSFFADFGVFGIDETYNQQRLNDINDTNLKVVTTHLGVDVGEDGKTHQCIDYIGIMKNLYGFKVIIPADPNQTDKAVRFAAENYGNFLIGVGRSKTPVIKNKDGSPFFGEHYSFEYGKIDIITDGDYPLFTLGAMVPYALKVHEILKDRGISIKILNVSCPTDINSQDLKKHIKGNYIFSYEDHNINTGLGSLISDTLMEHGGKLPRLIKFGINRYAYSGKPAEVFKLMEIDSNTVADRIENFLKH